MIAVMGPLELRHDAGRRSQTRPPSQETAAEKSRSPCRHREDRRVARGPLLVTPAGIITLVHRRGGQRRVVSHGHADLAAVLSGVAR